MSILTVETASEFDFMVLLDASGSMARPSARFPGKTRWNEAQESIFSTAAALEKYDADGIDVVVFGPNIEVVEGVTAAAVDGVFARRDPRGGTPLNGALKVVIDKQKKTGKKTVAVVFTDGEPDEGETVAKTLTDASNAIGKDEDLTILFVQIGDDAKARAYLDNLDNSLTGKFDIVDVVSMTDAENMEPLALIQKAIAD
jgi:uncharacterized protein with von Willebrand factor type A (vWA) domain